jgi:hypothetical protein
LIQPEDRELGEPGELERDDEEIDDDDDEQEEEEY